MACRAVTYSSEACEALYNLYLNTYKLLGLPNNDSTREPRF